LFFDLNANNTDTYYFDDLTLYGTGTAPGVCVVEATESYSASDLNMTFKTDPSEDFISDGAGFSWVDNPDFDNTVNSSCKVGKVVKANNNPWDNNQYDLDAKLDFVANTGLKIKVWSARANTEVRLKLEEIGNAGNNVEKFLTTSVTSGWEELTFPFTAADSGKFNKVVIFFDLNANNTDTYYFDDLKLYGNGSGGDGGGNIDGDISSNGGFETGDLEGWTLYDNGGSATLDNPEARTGDWCVKLFASAPSGLNPTLKQERKAAGSIVVGDKVQVTFSYKGSLTEPGLRLKHDACNLLHRYFEELQGTAWQISNYYKQADTQTKYAIRQLNNICHEIESWVLSYRKSIVDPEWVRPSQITTFLNAPRYDLAEEDYELFKQNRYDRDLGGVYLHWSQVGKTLFEVFRDEHAPKTTTDLVKEVKDEVTVGS
jgi:hypothetical protein